MDFGLILSAVFLAAAVVLLVSHKSALGRAVPHRVGLKPRPLAAFFSLLALTGIVSTADLRWFPGRTVLSVTSTVLLIASVVTFAILIPVAARRRSRADNAQVKDDLPMGELLDRDADNDH